MHVKLLRPVAVLLALLHIVTWNAQSNASPVSDQDNALRFVVIVSRHGVRSPTGKLDQLNRYSRQPWPTWDVPPGYLTAHGARLMTLLGTYDRALLVSQGILSPGGCADAAHIRIVADSDQRTRESGKALAAGLEPGCEVDVTARPEGTPDPLFHPLHSDLGMPTTHSLFSLLQAGWVARQTGLQKHTGCNCSCLRTYCTHARLEVRALRP
ncbi:MAG TPA: histidine-type phosphatase [Terracidiphilus sp.]|nr:histidine-type phosphatase [Terracidiphilus sp.]